jgi:transposase
MNMNEKLRHEVIQLYLGGASGRKIARMLGLSRAKVKRVIFAHESARAEGAPNPDLPAPRARRPSVLDPHEAFLRETLERYPDITATRLLEELQARGFEGKYTIVRERLRELRPSSRREPVVRFETAPGRQAQMDYSPFEIDFTREGRRQVHAFSYVLSYSRRQYLRFVESQDFTTTIREHVCAFQYLEGAAHVCLYDNMKVVVSGFDGDEPIYNPRFLAFATHYGFRPWACRRKRPQTKGKVERPFYYILKNLLNGRTFETLEHLNRFALWWLANRADVRPHRETKRRPLDMWGEERPHLRPLPAHPYDTAVVVYRVVDVEGYVAFRENKYSVPWQLIGELAAVRITERELVVYGKDLSEYARHELFPRSEVGQQRTCQEHRPHGRENLSREVLEERFQALGPACARFLQRLLERRRYGKNEAARILGLLALYRKQDLVSAIERAERYGAYSFPSVERILALLAEPRPVLEAMAEENREQLRELIEGERVEPRSTSEYQHLLDEEAEDKEDDQSGEAH